MWHVTHGKWHEISDTWHVTCDTGYMTPDTKVVMNIFLKLQVPWFKGLELWYFNKVYQFRYPILDIRLNCFNLSCVMLRVPLLYSETKWTGEFWSKTISIKGKTKTLAFKKNTFINLFYYVNDPISVFFLKNKHCVGVFHSSRLSTQSSEYQLK